MAMLDKVITGKIKKPHLALIYGIDGVGKTTFASELPKTIFIGKESGTDAMDVARFPEPQSYEDVLKCLEELVTANHPYQSVAIDSLDWIEPLVWDAVCKADGANSIEHVGGGYGKGYTEANRYWMRMIGAVQRVREIRKMNVVLIAHSQVKTFNDPSQSAPYDRYQLKLNEKAAALWREFVDFVGFATYEVYTKAIDSKGKKAKAFGDGKRVLYTERRPSFDAKNRLGLPFQIALSFAEFQKYADGGSEISGIKADIKDLHGLLDDEKTKKAVTEAVAKAGDDSVQLNKILNRLRVITTK